MQAKARSCRAVVVTCIVPNLSSAQWAPTESLGQGRDKGDVVLKRSTLAARQRAVGRRH